jgi:diguanylate cyclase (GGDEF)-like protein
MFLKRSVRVRYWAALGLGLAAAIASGALAVRPVSTIARGIRAHEATHEALARLAGMRSALPPDRVAGATKSPMARQLEGLEALLSPDPWQRGRLVRLRDLVRPEVEPADASPWLDDATRWREVGDLLTEMEREEGARLQGAHAAMQSSVRLAIGWGAAATVAALAVALAAMGLMRWEAARRRRTTRSLARLATQRLELEDRLQYLDKYDAMTGLPNRRQLVEILEREIREAKETSGRLSVLVLDVSRLRHVNDLLGREVGDQVLALVARKLRAAVGNQDTVARLGGSEFAVAQRGTSQAVDAGTAAEAIRDAASGGMRVGEHDVVVTSNVGVAVYPRHGGDARALLESAERALTRARLDGPNAIQVFDEGLRGSLAELFAIERRLLGALKNGEYLVHYQPYCDLATSEVGGAEALVKWRNETLGLIPAARFVPLLEETGMIVDVGRWVLETACSQIGTWQQARRGLPVSVNLSLLQFRDKRLLDTIADAISSFKVDPGHLTLEVTESICIQDMEFAVRTLKKLKDMGVSLSVDDFGTGYSSLSYLKKLPVDNIKIDISFVRDVTRDQDTASIVTAITSLARGLKLKTIAEGVETDEQRKILHLLRCDMGQGFLFSPAVPAAELEGLMARSPEARAGEELRS